jgi:hypothetical protein
MADKTSILRGHYLHHTSLTQGYVSRKGGVQNTIIKYKGRFGKGYKLLLPNNESTRYCYVQYWIQTPETAMMDADN